MTKFVCGILRLACLPPDPLPIPGRLRENRVLEVPAALPSEFRERFGSLIRLRTCEFRRTAARPIHRLDIHGQCEPLPGPLPPRSRALLRVPGAWRREAVRLLRFCLRGIPI